MISLTYKCRLDQLLIDNWEITCNVCGDELIDQKGVKVLTRYIVYTTIFIKIYLVKVCVKI